MIRCKWQSSRKRDYNSLDSTSAISANYKGNILDKRLLELPADVQIRLELLKAIPKFVPDDSRYLPYAGYLPAEKRSEAESKLNNLIDRIASGIEATPHKGFVLTEFRKTFDYFETSDTEDRERFCSYLENIMDAINMDSSEGVINEWMYGF